MRVPYWAYGETEAPDSFKRAAASSSEPRSHETARARAGRRVAGAEGAAVSICRFEGKGETKHAGPGSSALPPPCGRADVRRAAGSGIGVTAEPGRLRETVE